MVDADLTRSFGDFVAVDHVSFEVLKGETSGSWDRTARGKTTTIEMLAGLVRPSSGEGMGRGPRHRIETAAIQSSHRLVSQLFSLYGDLTVEETSHSSPGCRVSGARRKKGSTGPSRWRDSSIAPRTAHGGAAPRLSSASPSARRCFRAARPVFDEPTSGVDPLSAGASGSRYDLAAKRDHGLRDHPLLWKRRSTAVAWRS